MNKFVMEIEYNGKDFSGWQKQPSLRTVQGSIEEAIFCLTKQKVEVVGSGRTDSGVHALGQVAHFEAQLSLPPQKLQDILNHALPNDINIKSLKLCEGDFHARFSAKEKTYMYKILNSPKKEIFERDFVAMIDKPLDEKKMQECGDMLVGEHDFRGFCSSQTQVTSFVRKIFDINVDRQGDYIYVFVKGNGFLYNMVRIIVGTMVDYAFGKISKKQVQEALQNGDRGKGGKTMPACGLYLKEVVYLPKKD